MALNQFELTLVVATLHTTHITIEESLLGALDDAFATRKDGSDVIKERQPQMDIAPVGLLVSDITDNQWLALMLVLDDMTQCLFHRDADTTKTLSQIQKQSVEVGVLYGVIQLGTDTLGRHSQWQRANPLPVAVVA